MLSALFAEIFTSFNLHYYKRYIACKRRAALEMKQVKIEKLEKSVGHLALGGSPFGACYGADISVEECGKVLAKAIETGVTYIDTAPFYGQGRT